MKVQPAFSDNLLKNMKCETALQLYSLECDNGRIFTLEEIGKKFFAIDEKIARDQSSLRIASGHVACSNHNINHKTGGNQKRGNVQRQNRGKQYQPQQPHAITHAATEHRGKVLCYKCGEKGHIGPNAPNVLMVNHPQEVILLKQQTIIIMTTPWVLPL
jgi:hypothetical protein